jgi:methionyl-tRNA formyltransferase
MIDRGMDTGKLIKQFKLEIEPEDDQLSLTERLSALSCSKLN